MDLRPYKKNLRNGLDDFIKSKGKLAENEEYGNKLFGKSFQQLKLYVNV